MGRKTEWQFIYAFLIASREYIPQWGESERVDALDFFKDLRKIFGDLKNKSRYNINRQR